jgi:hypothetical protein
VFFLSLPIFKSWRPVGLAYQPPATVYFSQNKPVTSQQYFSLRTNQHQPPAKRTGCGYQFTHFLLVISSRVRTNLLGLDVHFFTGCYENSFKLKLHRSPSSRSRTRTLRSKRCLHPVRIEASSTSNQPKPQRRNHSLLDQCCAYRALTRTETF